jgi:GNAT superfamily N-acetyltransferase
VRFADVDVHPSGTALLRARSRWQRTRAEPPVLGIRVLASYTVDPLVPYLGVGLLDAGLPPSIRVGRYNQIVQQCVDGFDEGPDVLVVAPRFEEIWPDDADPTRRRESAEELFTIADTAVAAAGRWGCALVFVLPAIPGHRPDGVGDLGRVDGVVAGATAVREALRRRLSGRSGVCVADAEEAVRELGARRAYHPALFRLAKVPYTDELFSRLAGQIVGLLRIRYGMTWRGVVLDVDSLLRPGGDADERSAAVQALRGPVRELCHGGMRLALRARAEAADVWETLATEFPEMLRDLVEGWAIDAEPVSDQLAALADEVGVPADRTVLLTADPAVAAAVPGGAGRPSCVLLDDEPAGWPAALRLAGLFDRAGGPPVAPVAEPDPVPDRGVARVDGPDPMRDYIAGLDVRVTYRPVPDGPGADVAELVARAKDFALGLPARTDARTAIHVRDRYADHGLGGVVRMVTDATTATVDLFALSCPVLGKGVEDTVLVELVERAAARGCRLLLLNYRRTGDNHTALAFLAGAAGHRRSATGQPVEVRTVECPHSAR